MTNGNIAIKSKDISVVVQGPIYEFLTLKCLNSIRKNLPDSEIILSTWQGSDVSGLEFDKLVLSKDPGTIVYDYTTNAKNNINRQLVSTQEGLKKATRKYVMKFRSDVELLDTNFLKYFAFYDNFNPCVYFNKRPIVCNYYCRNSRIMPLAYHITDWFMFGFLEDVKKYYFIPLQNKEEDIWFTLHKKNSKLFKNFNCRYTPEQYICVKFLEKNKFVDCDCYYDCNRQSIINTESFVAKNMVILDYKKQLNINFPKYNPNRYLEKYTLLSFRKWQILFDYYCLKKNRIGFGLFKISSLFWKIIYKIRLMIIYILSATNTKEKIKKILTKLGEIK